MHIFQKRAILPLFIVGLFSQFVWAVPPPPPPPPLPTYNICYEVIMNATFPIRSPLVLIKDAINIVDQGIHSSISISNGKDQLDLSRARVFRNGLWAPSFWKNDFKEVGSTLRFFSKVQGTEGDRVTFRTVNRVVRQYQNARIRGVKVGDKNTIVLIENYKKNLDQFSHYSIEYIDNNLDAGTARKIIDLPEGVADYQDFVISEDGKSVAVLFSNGRGPKKHSIFIHQLSYAGSSSGPKEIFLEKGYQSGSDSMQIVGDRLLYSQDFGKEIHSVVVSDSVDFGKNFVIWEDSESYGKDSAKHYVKFYSSDQTLDGNLQAEIVHIGNDKTNSTRKWNSNLLVFDSKGKSVNESHALTYEAKIGESNLHHNTPGVPLIYPDSWGFSKVLKSAGRVRRMLGTSNGELVWIHMAHIDPLAQGQLAQELKAVERLELKETTIKVKVSEKTVEANGIKTGVHQWETTGASPRIFPVTRVIHLQDQGGIDPKDLKLEGVTELGDGYLLLRSLGPDGNKYQSVVFVSEID